MDFIYIELYLVNTSRHSNTHTLRAGDFSTKNPVLITNSHTHTFTHQWNNHGEQFGLQCLVKDSSTCGLEEPGTEPLNF